MRRPSRLSENCVPRPKVREAAPARAEREQVRRSKLESGELSCNLDGLRAVVEGARAEER